MKYGFVHKQAGKYDVGMMCEVLGVSRSGYCGWVNRPASARAKSDQALLAHILEVFEQSRCTYGYLRVHKALVARGFSCGRDRVARLMRQAGLRAIHKRKYRVTTQSDHKRPVAPNLLRQDFSTETMNQKWLTDITFVPTDQGWLYLAPVLDLYSRMVVGWAM